MGDSHDGLLSYPNVPQLIGAVISTGKATLSELGRDLSLEDVYDLLEIAAVDTHNQRILNPPE